MLDTDGGLVIRIQAWLGTRIYYGWIVVAVTALTLLVSAGNRAAPAVLVTPLEDDFGWSRASISFGLSIGLLLYGFAGPISGGLMHRFGPRALMLASVAALGVSVLMSLAMQSLWQFTLLWGIVSGFGTGVVGIVLGATVANRWFVHRRGLVTGIFGAATASGQLIFVPLLIWLIERGGWQAALVPLAVLTLLLLAPVALLMRDSPGELGLRASGEQAAPPAELPELAETRPGAGVMLRALRVPEFWLLAGSFFVCGATSNGLIGTHFVPYADDEGISKLMTASVIALMGAMTFAGTITSGWLTDRVDPRKLLAVYYGFRGLSLLFLPFIATSTWGLILFATFFGLDYIATVPPTATLSADIFGRRNVGTIFGWVFAAHQIGAASAAWLSGIARDTLGDYQLAFLTGGALSLTGALLALRINRHARPTLEPAPAVVAGMVGD